MKTLSIILISLLSFFMVPAQGAEAESDVSAAYTMLHANMPGSNGFSAIVAEELLMLPTGVCDIMPGSCACELQDHGDWDEFEKCLDDRYGPEEEEAP